MSGELREPRMAVVGAGTIGLGWAHLFARAGWRVTVYDEQPERLDDVPARLERTFADVLEAGLLDTAAVESALARVAVDPDLEGAVHGASWVQEAVPEDLVAKRAIFWLLERYADEDALLASSTSSLPMSEIAARLPGAARCVVVHPTNPPHLIPLVEIVPGTATAPAVVQRAVAVMRELGRTPIVCRREIFGFLLNRLQFALMREAMYLVRDGAASVADIDRCVSDGLGLRWAFLGPFGVEATNSGSLEEGLTKFNGFLREIFADVVRPYDGPTEDDVRALVRGWDAAAGTHSHDELVRYRDRMVLAAQALKASAMPAGDSVR